MNLAKLSNSVKYYILDTTPKNVVQKKVIVGIDPDSGYIVELDDTKNDDLVIFDCIYRDGFVKVKHIKSPKEGKKQINFSLPETVITKLQTLSDLEKRSATSMIEILIDREYNKLFAD